MKLISMTDFILEQQIYYNETALQAEWGDNSRIGFTDKIIRYAKFLKQPLELWMFAPCDENNNIVEYPLICDNQSIKMLKYIDAKERVLFEGFTVERAEWANTNILDLVINNDSLPVLSYDSDKKHIYDSDSSEQYIMFNIENLLDYYRDLTLTETAINQITP